MPDLVAPPTYPRISSGMQALVEGRCIVGLAAAAVCAIAAAIVGVAAPLPLLGAVCAATVVIYDLDRLRDRRGTPGPVPAVVPVTLLASLLALAFLLGELRRPTGLALLAGIPACVLYAMPLAMLDGRRPKDHAIGKVIFVAAAVTTATVSLPILESGEVPLTGRVVLAAIWAFVAVLGNTIACDLRDREIDAAAGLRTLAVRAGEMRTRRGLLLGLAVLTIGFGISRETLSAPYATIAPLVLLMLAVGVLRSRHAPWIWGLSLDGVFIVALLLL